MGEKFVFGEDDPFRCPPHEYNFGVLQAVEPFLTIHHTPGVSTLKGDKFRGKMLNKDMLAVCLNLIGEELSAYERSYAEAGTEGNNRPLHLEMIRQVEQFTKPSDTEFSYLLSDDPDVEGFFLACGDPLDPQEEEDVQESSLAGSQQEHRGDSDSGDSSQEEMSMEPPLGPQDVRTAGRTDCRVFVHDKGPSKRKDLPELEIPKLNSQRCAMLVEFKLYEVWEAIAQAAAYGRTEVRRNVSNRHYKPVYLVAFSKTKFTYAVLRAEGTIVTGGSKVSDEDYADFVSTTDPRSSPPDKQLINDMFAMGTKFLRQNYLKAKSRILYPRRHYVVGDLYTASEWYALPTTVTDTGTHSAGAQKFYEGLLRVIVGDRVLDWGVADAIAASATRMMQSKLQNVRAGGNMQMNLMLRSMQLSLCMGQQVDVQMVQGLLGGSRAAGGWRQFQEVNIEEVEVEELEPRTSKRPRSE